MLSSFRIVVIGASAGGLAALKSIVLGLPREMPAAVFVLFHYAADAKSHLPEILTHLGSLPASHAVDSAKIKPGHIYAAPPGLFHLRIDLDVMRLVPGPKEMNARPAADVLFRSAAAVYGPRVIGIVLSGMDGDGAAGIEHVKRGGGVTIVQEPTDATFPEMPERALARGNVDYCVPAAQIGPLLTSLVNAREADG